MKKLKSTILFAVLAVIVTSCSNPKSTVEYQALEAEVASINSQIQTTEEEIARRSENEELLQSLSSQREELIGKFASIVSDPTRRRAIISGLGEDSCYRYYMAEYELIGVVDGGGSAFNEAIKQRTRPGELILGSINWNFDEFPQSVQDYGSELANTDCLNKAQRVFLKSCETVDKKLMNKNPESFKGKCIKGTVRIAQFDTRTGPCAFQGYLGGGYDVRAQFGQTLNPDTHDKETECSWTEKLVEDNFITFWGYALGAYTYTTSNGGSQTVPAFKMFVYQK